MAAVDYFLKIDGIDGESTDAAHKGAIDIDSFSFGMHQASSGGFGSGAGTGKVQFQDMQFTEKVSKASPNLFLKCATGTHFKKVELFMRKAGGGANTPSDFMVITLQDCLISSYQLGGSQGSGDLPEEKISFTFGAVEFLYRPQNSDGTSAPPIRTAWDLKANRAA